MQRLQIKLHPRARLLLPVLDYNKQNGVMEMRYSLICLALLLFGVIVTVEAQEK
jgi:hypothetical protein